MRRAVFILVAVSIIVALVVTSLAWARSGDPFASLPRERGPADISLVEERRESWNGRTLLHVALEGAAVQRIRFVASLPDPMPEQPLPLVVVLGSLRGGSNAIRQISEVAGDPGPNAFIGYDWPLPEREPAFRDIVRRLPGFRASVLTVPGQIDALIAWASTQPWVDAERVSLLGFSLGAFVVPGAQRLAQERGSPIRSTIIAYAGAPIGAVVAGHPGAGPAWLRPVLGAASDLLLRPVEPSVHLPHLRGRFLVLGTQSDRLIARAAVERMEELTPEPRTVIRMGGDHMGLGPDRWQLLERVVNVSREWLLDQGAIDPAASFVPAEGR
jgi:dienelactone hydrolase